jgi:hypothetical protein
VEFEMLDLLYIGLMVVFFTIAVAYLIGCDRLRKGAKEE